MESRFERLLRKAEEAADRGDIEQSEQFESLANQAAFHAKREVKALEKLFAMAETEEE